MKKESSVKARLTTSRAAESVYRWTETAIDPIRLALFPRGISKYVHDWRTYSRMAPIDGKPRIRDSYPRIHDNTSVAPFDAQYFYQDVWASRYLISKNPDLHVDVGSHLSFVSMLASAFPVAFIDIRPLVVTVGNLHSLSGDGLQLPLRSQSVQSLSCLHVAEHVGLGRYGDRLDPLGSNKIARELERVLAPGGTLLFSVPVGRPRICFNAHRVFAPETVPTLFPQLELRQFSGISDERQFHEDITPDTFRQSHYSCGLYLFERPVPST